MKASDQTTKESAIRNLPTVYPSVFNDQPLRCDLPPDIVRSSQIYSLHCFPQCGSCVTVNSFGWAMENSQFIFLKPEAVSVVCQVDQILWKKHSSFHRVLLSVEFAWHLLGKPARDVLEKGHEDRRSWTP